MRKWLKTLPDGPTVTVIDRHGGRYARTGGEYEYRTHYRLRTTHDVVVYYSTSGQFDYCPHDGLFTRCGDRCQYEVVAIDKLPDDVQTAIRIAGETGDDVTIDGTGHDPTPCLYEGGCVICYPCNHAPCMAEARG